jgi:hypothetical protein
MLKCIPLVHPKPVTANKFRRLDVRDDSEASFVMVPYNAVSGNWEIGNRVIQNQGANYEITQLQNYPISVASPWFNSC